MHIAELWPRGGTMLAFINPHSTSHAQAGRDVRTMQQAFGVPDARLKIIEALPAPKHIQANVAGHTVVYSHGGDGTVNRVLSAITGTVQDDPAATAANLAKHRELASQLLYVAGTGGNAKNFALSALDQYTHEQAQLAEAASLGIGHHRPLVYEVLGVRGKVLRSGIVTSCIGLGASANIAAKLHKHKRQLDQYSGTERLAREALISADALLHTQPFAAKTTRLAGPKTIRRQLPAITGFEIIGSRVYAKVGRTQVNVDDSRYQVIITHHKLIPPLQVAEFVSATVRLKTGKHALKPIDFADNVLTLRLTSNASVPLQIDGEFGRRYTMQPGQSLRLRPCEIAVPTLMHG
jgi:diacylglycerol kinase family enzyme